jgi:DNA-directed RNA polymerase specialized sigma24 family protein
MSRNFTSDEILADKLLLSDTAAFEELYRRYCFPLYSYCLNKLKRPDDARRIVRDIFIQLWETRHALPVNFSISLHLYTAVRKAVILCIDQKLEEGRDGYLIEAAILPGFNIARLQQARMPVQPRQENKAATVLTVATKRRYDQLWWNRYPSVLRMKGLRHSLQHLFNLI